VLLVGRAVRFTLGERGHNAAELRNAEEAVAAGVAAISGKAQPALHEDERSVFHAFAGDMLEVEIAAAGTVREAFEDGSNAPGMKSPLAAMAAPRAQTGCGEHEVENPVAVRTKAIVTATLRTNHRYPGSVAQDTEKPVGGQDVENTQPAGSRDSAERASQAAAGLRCEPTGMDNPALLGDNFAQIMRQPPRPRRLNEFDPEYAR
jgi:hypothetical protein